MGLSACGGGSSNGDGLPAGLGVESDEFDGDLSNWSFLNFAEASVQIQDGQVQVEPVANSLWFNADSGVLVYKNISGNFRVTSYATVRSLDNPLLPPQAINLGGLMAHAPQLLAADENYVHIAYGSVTGSAIVETKTTIDNQSNFQTSAWPTAEGELGICRVGDTFMLLNREFGSEWQVVAQYERPDLPETLEVGMMSYSNANPDLLAEFEYIHFSIVEDLNGCDDE